MVIIIYMRKLELLKNVKKKLGQSPEKMPYLISEWPIE
jgi:hypothetical protein